MLNIEKIRSDFPSLNQKINGRAPIYFDNSCMTLRPQQVIDKISEYYERYPACGDRSHHYFAQKVTQECGLAREKIAKFINAKPQEIVFTRNTTEGINLIAQTLFNQHFLGNLGDLNNLPIVITSDKEHNSNLVPWQILESQKKVKRAIINTNKDGGFDLETFKIHLQNSLSKPPRFRNLVSLVFSSNLDGVTYSAEEIIRIAHQYNFLVLLDAAQAVGHQKIDVKKLDVDFLAFSGHKMLGPSGIGVLYGKFELLQDLPPFLAGGETVGDTTYQSAQFLKPPHKFEAGLQDYAGILGLGAAVEYLEKIGLQNIHLYESELNSYLDQKIRELDPEIKIIGPTDPLKRSSLTAFYSEKVDHHKIALLLNSMSNIMVRSGSFCLHSWFNEKKIKGAVRASFYLYNTKGEIDVFVETLEKILSL